MKDLWRNFHCNYATSDDFREKDNDLEDNDQLIRLQMERAQCDQSHNRSKNGWYFVDHIRVKPYKLISILGTFHAYDEMMMDYEINVEHGEMGSMILYLVDSIVKLKEK